MSQEMMNSCSKKVQLKEYMQVIRNENMKHIAAKGINSVYGTSNSIVLFGEDTSSQRNSKRHKYAHERRPKK